MKLHPILVTFSIAINVVVIGVIALRPAATKEFLFDVLHPAADAPTDLEARRAADEKLRAAQNAQKSKPPLAWSDFQANDFPGLIARLRAAGFPPSVVNSIVLTVVGERFAARRRELMPNRIPTEYWKNPRDPRTDAASNAKMIAAMRELDREQNKLFKELLGPDLGQSAMNDEWYAVNQRRQFGDLAPAKVEQLKKIMSDYDELSSKVHEDSLGIILPEDRAKLALLEREKRADLERLLTPDELLDYDLRNNPSAHEIRNRLGQFEATEEEFRALYAVQKAFDEKYTPRDAPLSPALARQRNDAQKLLDAQFQTALGDARYAEFKQANDAVRQGFNGDFIGRLVSRLELPPSTTGTVLTVQQDIQQRAAALRTDRNLSAEDRGAQLESLAGEAADKLTSALGPRGFEAYKQNGGQWLQTLARSPGAPSPAPTK